MIGGWEWVVIALAVVAILVWGPAKIPELARGIGRARGEFERASREYSVGTPKSEKENETSGDDMMILIATGLGVDTKGKTKDKIFQEILANIKASKASS